MNYDIHIENLGAIKKADITITPLTILAGENGTGKSFVTKFLYSVLNVINTDIYSDNITRKISQIISLIEKIINHENTNLSLEDSENLNTFKETLSSLKDIINQEHFSKLEIIDYTLVINEIKKNALIFDKDILSSDTDSKKTEVKTRNRSKEDSSKGVLLNNNLEDILFKIQVQKIPSKLDDIIECFEDPNRSYIEFTKEALQNELKENFQISELRDIINFAQSECVFKIHKLINIIIDTNNNIHVDFDRKYFEKIVQINRLVFFESPVYWRLLTLIKEDERSYKRLLSKDINDEKLSGVPKHFLDLKELLFAHFKDGERPKFVIESANSLKMHLKGNFEPTNNDLVFQNLEGQNVSKSLVSFGMTNIGIIQAVLSKNIINKGAFVFIDEPESNLHPEWQAILANVLVHLAKNGVYVIVTTHSSDMLKAFDISTKEQKINEKLSTYYFESNGKLLNMFDEELTPIEQARRKLLETYENLMIRGYLL